MAKPKILITNDDGIYAPGIKTLWEAVAEFADVMVVAPAENMSGAGVSITLNNPLRMESIAWQPGSKAWKVSGKPADCVKLGLRAFFPGKPDLILSGINRGPNSGRTVFYSGTVGGVIEGALRRVPGIAFSNEAYAEPNFDALKKYILPIVEHTLKHPLPTGTILNVNFPEKPIQGIRLASQGLGYMNDNPDERVHPTEGTPYFWLGEKWEDHDEHHQSDVVLLSQGYITAVPIRVQELTHHQHIEDHRSIFEEALGKLF
ncbi:MAG: 5'/3'-nucleotidase SurE [Rhabdochlamydiaceae bacterium]|jgi:5'-nucleotidase